MEGRKKLRKTLQNCIHPLRAKQHNATKLLNIQTGYDTSYDVNVTESVKIKPINSQQMTEGFHEKLSSNVVTMSERRKKSS